MWSTLLSVVLVINELMASNAGVEISPAINFDSWIEVYNPSDQAVNLGGMYLSDDANNLKKWQMPSDMGKVPAKGFKVIWLGSADSNELQAPFKLDCDGGAIYLSDSNGSLVTSEEYPTALSRTAWARKTDGGDDWGWTSTPTLEASNATAIFANQRLDAPKVSVDSKLFSNSLTINVTIPEGARLAYTTNGSLPTDPKDIPTEDPWTQRVKNGDCEGEDASNLAKKDGDKGKIENLITDGVGVNDSRGVTVHSIKSAKNDNTTQFFVYTPDHIWQTGEKFRFSMKVKADKKAKIKAFAQKKPGEDIVKTSWGGWGGGGSSTPVSMLASQIDVTTEWTTISYEGTITADQADEQQDWGGGGWWGGGGSVTITYSLQTIAFNLNISKTDDNNFYFDEISWESLPAGYTEFPTKESTDGIFSISKTTNYTFRLFQDGYLPSVPVTRSYIQTTNKYTLPIISIVGDERFFTDPKIGLDCDGDGTNGKTGNGQNSPKNYNCDWDRPVNFSYMSPEGKMLFNQDVNISVSGGYTRSQNYRSFKLKSNKVFDGMNRLDYMFFPQKPYNRNKTLLIRNGGNDIWRHNARFIDPALETIIQRSGIDLDVQSYVPIIEYVNGELRGVFNMREPNNDKFAYANFGYDDEELDALENSKVKNGSDEVMKRIYELGKRINEAGVYEELMTLLDIDEYTNYMAVTFFLHNDDWPDNNIKCYRSQNNGRYRFVSFDLDYAFKGCWNNSKDNPFENFAQFKGDNAPRTNNNKEFVNLFLNLLQHDGFRKKFIDTFCLMGGSVFEPTRANAIVDELLNNVKAMCKLMKDQYINDGHDPDRSASTIKSNLKGRSKKMTDYMKKFSQMKLSGVTQQAVTLSADAEGASLYVNGLEVPYADFNGHLFAPVTLEAKAPAGYKFTGWKNGDEIVSTEAEMELPSDATVSLVACFEALSDDQLMAQGINPVRINEVSAANSIYANEFWKRNDWVELYNTTNKDIDVAGMYLSDNANKPKKYQIAANGISTIVPAHGYLIVWCDKLEPESQLHASFKLAAEGGDVLLTAADESWCDHFVYTEHKGDETVGRYPDGAAEVYVMNTPTIAKSNIISSYVKAVEQPIVTGIRDLMADVAEELSVRYAEGRLAIRSTQAERLQVRITNLAGQSVATLPVELTGGATEISVEQLPASVYVAVITDQQGHKATCKFIKR
ncbi:MAG: lamin tail domain-containing protein [Prevotella sp.]|nr:lamin tail domain-containing protein [Prevotella sp.]